MLRLGGFEKESFTDGVGIRYTVFTQGCKHNCSGCHNTQTHSFTGGSLYDINDIIDDIKEHDYLDGVTLSGGDPLFQAKECAELAKRIKEETSLNIWCYTGFRIEDLMASRDTDVHKLLKYVDVMVDGKFELENKDLRLRFRGSSNQRIIDVKKSTEENKVVLLGIEDRT